MGAGNLKQYVANSSVGAGNLKQFVANCCNLRQSKGAGNLSQSAANGCSQRQGAGSPSQSAVRQPVARQSAVICRNMNLQFDKPSKNLNKKPTKLKNENEK